MDKLLTPDGKPVTDEKTEEQKLDEIILPRLEAPTFFYKKDSKMFWLAIPVDKTDAFTACCIIDSMKLNYVHAFNTIMAELREMKNKIVPANTGGMRNFVNKLCKK